MRFTILPFLFLSLLFTFTSCEKEDMETKEPSEMEEKEPGTNNLGSIKVYALVCDGENDPGCIQATELAGVQVFIYNSASDRSSDVVKAQKITASDGTVTFSGLQGGKRYYLKSISPHGTVLSDDTTPVNGLAHLDVIFYL